LYSILANFARAVSAKVEDCDFLAFSNVTQCMYSMSFDALVPTFLCVIIASMVDATGFQEETSANSAHLYGKRVGATDTETLLGNI
jgi:hypothetical protein